VKERKEGALHKIKTATARKTTKDALQHKNGNNKNNNNNYKVTSMVYLRFQVSCSTKTQAVTSLVTIHAFSYAAI